MPTVNVRETMPEFAARLLRALAIRDEAVARMPATEDPTPEQATDVVMAQAALRIVAESFKRRLDYEVADTVPDEPVEGWTD